MTGRIQSGETTTVRLRNGDYMDVVSFIKENRIVAIARRVDPKRIAEMAKALEKGGIKLLEITFDQSSKTCIDDTVSEIAAVKEILGTRMCVGAGTVVTVEQAIAAFEAGADFALAPDTNVAVIRKVKELGMVSVPGAFTPTEILQAWNAGADIVKLFPAGNLGIPYLKAIRGPISHVPLMAVGGVDEDNAGSFLDNGFCSCGIGSNLVRNDLINDGKFEELAALAERYAAIGAERRN